jgi:hypothetical protein
MTAATRYNEFLLALLGMPEGVVVYEASSAELSAEQKNFAKRFFRFFESRVAHGDRDADEALADVVDDYRQVFTTAVGTELLVFELRPKEDIFLDSTEAELLLTLYDAFPEAEAERTLALFYEH